MLNRRGRSRRITCAIALAVGIGALAIPSISAGAIPRAKASGTPIKLGMYANLPSNPNPINNYQPEALAAVKAGIKAINDAGGIKGAPLELVFCDPVEDPNVAGKCARQFVDEKVVAVVGSSSVVDSEIMPILQEASIANVGMLALSAADYTANNSFPLDSTPAGVVSAGPFICKQIKRTNVAAMGNDVAAAQTIYKFIKAAAESAGVDYKGAITFPNDSPDLAPYVASAMSQDVNCIVGVMATDYFEKAYTAAEQSDADIIFGSSDSAWPLAKAKAFGVDKLQGFFGGALFPPPTTSKGFPLIDQYNKDLDAAFKRGDKTAAPALRSNTSFRPWLSVHVVAEMLKTMTGPITASEVLDAMNTAPKIDLGNVAPPLTWTKPGPITVFPRVVNPWAWKTQITKQGTFKLIDKKPFPVLEKVDFGNALKN